jgi:hypothetical protein
MNGKHTACRHLQFRKFHKDRNDLALLIHRDVTTADAIDNPNKMKEAAVASHINTPTKMKEAAVTSHVCTSDAIAEPNKMKEATVASH